MPFIDARLTVPVSAAQQESLKAAFGKAIPTLHKTESYLMVAIAGDTPLWLGGRKLEKGAYVAVSLYGHAAAADETFDQIAAVQFFADEIIHSSRPPCFPHPAAKW